MPVLLLDANGHISQTPWPEQIGQYSSKKNYIQWSVLGRTLAIPSLERLSLDPSPTLRSTLRVFLLLFMFTDVARCTTTEIDCNWQQPRGEGIIVPFSVSFNISLHIEYMKKGKSINGTRTSLHSVPFSRRTGRPFCHEWRKHAGTMKSGTIWRLPIFGRNSIKCS